MADRQYADYKSWLEQQSGKRVTIIELGAGSTVPTVRRESEQLAMDLEATIVRINPGEPNGPPGTIEIPLPAHDVIEKIDDALPRQFHSRAT